MLPEKNSPESQERDANRRAGTEMANCNNEEIKFTEVPNAHASGLGAMGRNDEKLPSSPDAQEERPDPAY